MHFLFSNAWYLWLIFCCYWYISWTAAGRIVISIDSSSSEEHISVHNDESCCMDGIRNGDETDVDCGGVKCSKCVDDKACKRNCDCLSDNCENKKCLAFVSCNDKRKDEDETDIDCGGLTCPKCKERQRCKQSLDCMSNYCNDNHICSLQTTTDTTTMRSTTTTSTESTTTAPTESTTTTSYRSTPATFSESTTTTFTESTTTTSTENTTTTYVESTTTTTTNTDSITTAKITTRINSESIAPIETVFVITPNSESEITSETVTSKMTEPVSATNIRTTLESTSETFTNVETRSDLIISTSTASETIFTSNNASVSTTASEITTASLATSVIPATSAGTGNTTCASNSIVWKNYTWCLRSDINNERESNNYVANNIWVDNNDSLHLQITNSSDVWTYAELYTHNQFTFGTFQWQIEGRMDTMDSNVVLGLVLHDPLVTNVKDINKIDIEFSRWGQNSSTVPNLFYDIWPASVNDTKHIISFVYNQTSPFTTHQITWLSASVSFESFDGFSTNNDSLLHSWHSPDNYAASVPQLTAPVRMNLWIYHNDSNSRSPSGGKSLEIIIHNFTYVEQAMNTAVPSIDFNASFRLLYILITLYFSVTVRTFF